MRNVGLDHQLFPSVPVFHGRDGRFDAAAQAHYVGWMAGQPIGGVAVWTPFGRGAKLDDPARAGVLHAWRDGLGPGKTVIAAVGPAASERHPERVIASARSMARFAADGGADAVLVDPPRAFRGRPELDNLALEYHAAIADIGLPAVVAYYDESAGGVAYRPHVLAQLVARPEVVGVHVATLNNVMRYQDIVALVRQSAPATPILTGEARFLGYSLMAGADGAILGMASACTRFQSAFLSAYWSGEASDFLRRNRAIDTFARHTFVSPIEGATRRMLWCLVHEGVIPAEAAHDPWAPPMGRPEFEQIGACLKRLRESEADFG